MVNGLQLRPLALFLWLVYVFICYFSFYALLVDVIYSHEIIPSQMGFLEIFSTVLVIPSLCRIKIVYISQNWAESKFKRYSESTGE